MPHIMKLKSSNITTILRQRFIITSTFNTCVESRSYFFVMSNSDNYLTNVLKYLKSQCNFKYLSSKMKSVNNITFVRANNERFYGICDRQM